MKEAIQEITDAVAALWQMSSKFNRGQTIEWSQIEAIAGQRNENRSKHIIGKWRRKLEREREIVTLVADTVGVRLLTDKEAAIEIPRLRQKRAFRQINRAIKQTAIVNKDRLSMHERRVLEFQRDAMKSQRRELHRSQKALRNGVVKTECNPRRPVVT